MKNNLNCNFVIIPIIGGFSVLIITSAILFSIQHYFGLSIDEVKKIIDYGGVQYAIILGIIFTMFTTSKDLRDNIKEYYKLLNEKYIDNNSNSDTRDVNEKICSNDEFTYKSESNYKDELIFINNLIFIHGMILSFVVGLGLIFSSLAVDCIFFTVFYESFLISLFSVQIFTLLKIYKYSTKVHEKIIAILTENKF
ncbi:hypothetical protein KFV05_08905 [Macrococcoides canis]|uniref:hypothetical protein n=1 Tax=Macrococcoides canis TaxID=1855823 RepID=UPI0020B7565E|nr:hypothetical protein [Macrococcus canis]UTH01829.1 hypothetical protein KFV05_08905 [Macrococcus canis]